MAQSTLTTMAVAMALPLLASAIGAGPNTLAFYNPNQRTMSFNGTWMIVPVPKAAAAAAVAPFTLTSCTADRLIFPNGFPAGQHPVLVNTGYQFDIRMASLEIDALATAGMYVPCVDRLADGKTNFQLPVASYIGGADGQDLMSFVPAAVGSLENDPITVAKVYPDYAAYRALSSNEFSSQVKQLIAPNTVSGPGVIPSAIDLDFFAAQSNQYSAHTFHYLINEPSIAPILGLKEPLLGRCFRNYNYFNETFTNMQMRTGKVTLYNVTSQPAQFTGRYVGAGGFSANSQVLGYPLQSCSDAAAQNDKSAQI